MKLTIDHTAFAAAVSTPSEVCPPGSGPHSRRSPAGRLQQRVRISAFDYEISADTTAAATVTETGRALVSGRLLSDIVCTVRGDVHLELRGPRLVLKAGSARFILPTLPLDEYPALPEPGTITGTLDGPAFAEAVAQVACAVSREESLPTLTGIGLHHDSEAATLTLYATDATFAVRTLSWKDANLPDTSAVIPGRALRRAKATADDTTVDLALPTGDAGLFTLRSDLTTTAIRALEGELPKYDALFPTEFAHTATVEIAPLKAAAQRVALVSAKKDAPIKLTFTADSTLVLEGGTGDDAQAVDSVDTSLTGGELTIAFNPAFLLDGLNALMAESVQFDFISPTKPAVLRAHDGDDQASATSSCRSG
uniref:Putative DNA-polymerase III, beta chain n=1 Tax=Streptomyces coelicolor (strain ATCC BAA-471 / A3(2) / M145) TaxID=100226 RepID=Q9L6H4_STRCO|nr:putative DNA-polymerase III, beta chain [Streptomyces coelicolor A3(2)]